MNQVNLTARLTRDPELKKLGDSDRDVCELRLAVDNGRSRDGEDRDATFIDVATFDAAARACAEHLTKGRQVAVSGRLVYREWEADDGSKRSKHSVIGRVEFLAKPQGSAENGSDAEAVGAGVGAADEDIAF
ncbi:MAG: single-stranded DNA-binding protein [Solirubrobacterales bacterium]|nr:single-stranded DNA-binding protein [Solirubrobacterales bacterium]